MATRTIHQLIDDIDASTEGVASYQFAIDGAEYEIDLSPTNRDRLYAALAPFRDAGRRVPAHRRAAPPAATNRQATGQPTLSKPTPARVRAWWGAHPGQFDLPAHRANGPIPAQVHAAFEAAQLAASSQPVRTGQRATTGRPATAADADTGHAATGDADPGRGVPGGGDGLDPVSEPVGVH